MTQWYCYVQGKRYGPIGEEVLRSWIGEGRLLPSDLVWGEGMANWQAAAGAFPELYPAAAAGAQPYYAPGLVPVAPLGGTGGASSIGELMNQAGAVLGGNWGLAIGFSLLLFLLVLGAGLVPYVGWLAQLILQGPFGLGGAVFFLTLVRGGRCELNMLFAGFKQFGTALGAHLLVILLVIAWMLGFAAVGIIVIIAALIASDLEFTPLVALGAVLLLPGYIAAIVAQLRYFQTMYLIADNRNIGALEAIDRSKQLMRGHKLRLFWICLLHGLLSILCVFTLCIGFLWLTPWMSSIYARFYDDLQPPKAASAQGVAQPGAFAS